MHMYRQNYKIMISDSNIPSPVKVKLSKENFTFSTCLFERNVFSTTSRPHFSVFFRHLDAGTHECRLRLFFVFFSPNWRAKCRECSWWWSWKKAQLLNSQKKLGRGDTHFVACYFVHKFVPPSRHRMTSCDL